MEINRVSVLVLIATVLGLFWLGMLYYGNLYPGPRYLHHYKFRSDPTARVVVTENDTVFMVPYREYRKRYPHQPCSPNDVLANCLSDWPIELVYRVKAP